MRHLITAALLALATAASAEVDVNARGLFEIRIDANPATHIRVFETNSSTTLNQIETGDGYTATYAGLASDPVEFETLVPWGGIGAFVNLHLAGAIAAVPNDGTGRQLTHGILKATMDVENLGPDMEQAVLRVAYDLGIDVINDTAGAVSVGRSDILFELNGEQIGFQTFSARTPTDPSVMRDIFIYQFEIPPGTRPAQITITIATVAYVNQAP